MWGKRVVKGVVGWLFLVGEILNREHTYRLVIILSYDRKRTKQSFLCQIVGSGHMITRLFDRDL